LFMPRQSPASLLASVPWPLLAHMPLHASTTLHGSVPTAMRACSRRLGKIGSGLARKSIFTGTLKL
jgi:hypothetical protein